MTRIYTIGYGSKDFNSLIDRLGKFGITHLVDVRTNPYSRYQEDFRGEAFGSRMNEAGVRYVFMGDRLGGKPERAEVLTDGRLDPSKLLSDDFFLVGIDKLIEAASDPERKVCLLCGCAKAAECHRGRFLGDALALRGIDMLHITSQDEIESQADVVEQITKGQLALF